MITGSGSQKGSKIGVSTLCRHLHHGPHFSRMTPHFCGMPLALRLTAPKPYSMNHQTPGWPLELPSGQCPRPYQVLPGFPLWT